MRRLRLPLERATLGICERCGHGVTLTCTRRLGPEAYGAGQRAREEFERRYLPARLRSYERGLQVLGPARGRALLDVGSNYGDFLALAAARGWRVAGVEPGRALRDDAVPGARTATVASLEEAAALGPFAAVTLWDVLEHLSAPQQHLARLARLVVPHGHLLVRVPDGRVFTAVRSRRLWRLLGQPYLTICHPCNPEEHVSHFTPASLRTIARRAGLEERARIDAFADERVWSGATAVDVALRRLLHRLGRRLPYEFTTMLERRP